jgi:site-specific DNA-methyltransferase (adenine-specific)
VRNSRDRIFRNLLDSNGEREEGPRYWFREDEDHRLRAARGEEAIGSFVESGRDMYHADRVPSTRSFDNLPSGDQRPARQVRERSSGAGSQIGLFDEEVAVTEFSQLRASAGYEMLDVVDQFGAGYSTVARWETGAEPAPPSVLRALQEIGKFAPASLRRPKEIGRQTCAGVENSLFEGDCLKMMKHVPTGTVDLVLCDLPYGTTQNRWDSVIDLGKLWAEYRRVLKPNGVLVLTFKYKIVWEKSKPTNFLNAKKQPLRKHEDICVFYSKPPTYNPQMRPGTPYDKGVRKNQLSGSYGDFQPAHVRSDGERYPADIVYFKTAESEPERTVWHPTQKPVELGRYLVRTFSNEDDVVLDNAFGSGSFLVAAAMENRRFIGIERNEEVHLFKNERIDYVTLAAERLKRVGVAPNVFRR